MAENRPPPPSTATDGERIGNGPSVVSDSELARGRLRRRWELASVLNFLNVFEPVIGSNLKISAEEIETALIKPNDSLAQLHITLLKGIPPVSKTLNASDAWVTALCKKLAMWWPWVAEGDYPLAAAKGEETSRYRELDPTNRLMILKALCEIRADQDDTVSYINDAIKNGTELSTFRKHKIGGDGNGTAYWYDGNAIIGHRLYKEVNKFESKPKVKDKGTVLTINCEWETLATNLKEFHEVVDEFSSSEVKMEVAVSKAVETDAIPVLEKLQKKKEKALKQRHRQELLLNGFRNSEVARSCRSRRPVCYTFDEYDKAIDEAIQQTKKRKTTGERGQVGKNSEHRKRNGTASNEGSDPDTKSRDSESTESESRSDRSLQGGDVDDNTDDEYDGKKDDNGKENDSDSSSFDNENINLGNKNHLTLKSQKQADKFAHRPKGSRWSERVAKFVGHPIPETGNLGAKNRLRQRPTRNTALESTAAPDSEDENEGSIAPNSEDENEGSIAPDSEDENEGSIAPDSEDEENSSGNKSHDSSSQASDCDDNNDN